MNQEQTPPTTDDWYEEYQRQEKLKRVEGALLRKHESDEIRLARLEQIHERLRHTNYKDSWAKLEEERQTYISSVGEFDPLLMARQFGFDYSGKSVFPVDDGLRIANLQQGATKISLLKGQHTGKDNLQVRIEQNSGTREAEAESKLVPFPKTAQQFYDIMAGLNLGFNFSAKHQAAYEANYVQQAKNQ